MYLIEVFDKKTSVCFVYIHSLECVLEKLFVYLYIIMNVFRDFAIPAIDMMQKPKKGFLLSHLAPYVVACMVFLDTSFSHVVPVSTLNFTSYKNYPNDTSCNQ